MPGCIPKPLPSHTRPHTLSLTPSLNGSDQGPPAVAPSRNYIAWRLLFRYISCPGHRGNNQKQPLIVGEMAGATDQCGTSLHRMISLDRRTLESKYRRWTKCHRCLRSSQRTQISTNQLGTRLCVCVRAYVCVVRVRLSAYKHVCGFFPVWNMNRYPGRRRGCKCVRLGTLLCYPSIVMCTSVLFFCFYYSFFTMGGFHFQTVVSL